MCYIVSRALCPVTHSDPHIVPCHLLSPISLYWWSGIGLGGDKVEVVWWLGLEVSRKR